MCVRERERQTYRGEKRQIRERGLFLDIYLPYVKEKIERERERERERAFFTVFGVSPFFIWRRHMRHDTDTKAHAHRRKSRIEEAS